MGANAEEEKRRRRESKPDPATEIPDAFWSDMDPDGSMSERPDYWVDEPRPAAATRLAWLRHRLEEAARLLGATDPDPWAQPRTSQEEWIRLSEQALGPLPRPADMPQEREARSSAPNARQPARKPKAYSPRAAGI